MKFCFGLAVVAAALLLAAANAPGADRLTEIFVPQTTEFTKHHPLAGISCFDLSPDGNTVAVEFGTQEPDKTFGAWVALWDVRTGDLIAEKQVEGNIPTVLSGHGPGMPALPMAILWYSRDIRFSPDGRMLLVLTGPRLVALSFPGLKVLYSIEDRVLAENMQTQMFIEGFSMAAKRLAVLEQVTHNSPVCEEPTRCSLKVMIADLDDGKIVAEWDKPGLSRSIALSSDGNLLALTINPVAWEVRSVPVEENDVFIVKADSGEVVRAFNSGYAAGDAEFLPGSAELLTIPPDHGEGLFYPRDAVRVWNLKTGQLERQLSYPKYGVRGYMSVSANGEWMAVTNVWWDVSDLKFDRDNRRAYARLLLWNLSSGKLVYDSGNLGQEYDLAGAPVSLFLGTGRPPFLARLSASGGELAVGGNLISVRSLETDTAKMTPR